MLRSGIVGFRYRKSINLGGGFKVNLSKSGVGYSWGVKGYRITKTSKGSIRRTASIPGTGISYVRETGEKNNKYHSVPTSNQPALTKTNNYYDTQDIVNNVATSMVSEGLEDMLSSASLALKLDTIAKIGFCITFVVGFAFPLLFLFAVIFALLMIYVRKKGIIDLNYTIDEEQQALVDEILKPMIKITQCKKVWRVTQTSKVIDQKYASGANNSIHRTTCKTATKPSFPFKTNLEIASFKTGKETLLFLPDKLLIIQGNKIGALNYTDVSSSVYTTKFIESESVPTDSQIVGQTWKYVNKSGGPDKRFKDNKQLPICLYGEIKLTSASGLNTVLMFSNSNVQ